VNDLTLMCGACRKPVEHGSGYLSMRFGDLSDHRRAQAAWDETHPGDLHDLGDFLLAPEDVHWGAWHAACDPRRDEDAYQIDDERIDSWRQLTWWTSHLMAKNWLESTDWDHLLQGIADGTDTRIVITVASAA